VTLEQLEGIPQWLMQRMKASWRVKMQMQAGDPPKTAKLWESMATFHEKL
jgi:hypothetical protein